MSQDPYRSPPTGSTKEPGHGNNRQGSAASRTAGRAVLALSALLCLMIAPVIGALIGIVGVVAGVTPG